MKNEIRLALLCMAVASAPAFAQANSPMCGNTNLDQAQNIYTIKNQAAGAVNEQCFIIVYQNGAKPSEASQYPGSYFVEGKYTIDLVGGGGGGGGGGTHLQGGGGGGAGAAPVRTVQYLAPGVYKMTIGTGGEGGRAYGGATGAGNPTSLTNAYTGALVAGFAGADTWTQQSQMAGSGRGGVGAPGGSSGGDGGGAGSYRDAPQAYGYTGQQGQSDRDAQAAQAGSGAGSYGYTGQQGPSGRDAANNDRPAQAGGALQTPGYAGVPGQAGREDERSEQADRNAGTAIQANAGGGGGASIGSGATGGTERSGTDAQAGGRGGPGMIKLTLLEATPQVVAAAPAPVAAPQAAAEPAPAADRPARKARN